MSFVACCVHCRHRIDAGIRPTALCALVRDGSRHERWPRQTWLRGPVLRASGACDGCGRTEAVAGIGGAVDAGAEGRVVQGAERQGRRGRWRAACGVAARPSA